MIGFHITVHYIFDLEQELLADNENKCEMVSTYFLLGKSKLREKRQGSGNAGGGQTKGEKRRVRKRGLVNDTSWSHIVDTYCDKEGKISRNNHLT